MSDGGKKRYAPISDSSVKASATAGGWEYLEADTQHLTHNIHRYSGKFIPQIAARAIEMLSRPGELILDPYCGSGTCLVEAVLLRRRAIGVDLSPLAALIATTKITPIPKKDLEELSGRMEALVDALDNATSQLALFSNEHAGFIADSLRVDTRLADPWFIKWYQTPVLDQLVVIDRALAALPNEKLRNVGRIAFSDILRKSSNAHTGYPNVMFHKAAPQRTLPARAFLRALEKVTEMVASLEGVSGARWQDAQVLLQNNTALELNSNSVDAIITHPPYIGSIPYAEYGALSLKWLGADPKELDRQLTGGKRQTSDVVERFEKGYSSMLTESFRLLRPGRHIFLMVGNPVVRAKKIDLAQMTKDLAARAGFHFVVQVNRAGVNRRANKMGEEHLLFFSKPTKRFKSSPASAPKNRPSV